MVQSCLFSSHFKVPRTFVNKYNSNYKVNLRYLIFIEFQLCVRHLPELPSLDILIRIFSYSQFILLFIPKY